MKPPAVLAVDHLGDHHGPGQVEDGMNEQTLDPSVALRTHAERERLLLAPYAMHSSNSKGRQHPESEHPYRGPYQRDRDRILHSAAYRRLSGKMQVFTGDMGDYHRTRLTHTQEVASIARTLGRSLRLNEDLIEALALLHDLGHPPFGHAGEDVLAECLGPDQTFSHNQHALTIAVELETRYPEFPGLNLTLEVLEGQQARVDKSEHGAGMLLESQLVDVADSVTYDAHDTDDALKLGIVSLEELAEIPLIRALLRRIRARFTDLDSELTRMALVHELIDFQVGDLLRNSVPAIEAADLSSAEEACRVGRLILPSRELDEMKGCLERFLFERVYRNERLLRGRNLGQTKLKQLFKCLCGAPHFMPPRFQRRAEILGLPRSVVDYLAGMTDRFCDSEYRRLFPADSPATVQGVV